MDRLLPTDPNSIGDWELTGRIASSTYSIIYLGKRGVEGAQEAAIKVLSAEFSSDAAAIKRLQKEVEILKKIDNPHVAKLLNYNLETKPAYIAIEYLNRKNLDIKLKQDGVPITDISWWRLACYIFDGLKAIHLAGVTHKDIKPANIMIDGNVVKIIDFGISHISGQTEISSSTMHFEGSRLFAAPENFQPVPSQKMDVFSAAVTLAYAGRLKSIWNTETESTLSHSIAKGSPNLEGLTQEQIEFLLPLLDKPKSKRPSSEDALQNALDYLAYFTDIKNPKPKPLKASSRLYRLTKKREFSAISIASFVVLIAIALTSIVSDMFVPNRVTSWLTKDSVVLTSDQLEKVSACKNLASVEEYQAAINACREPAELGDAWAQYTLGYSLGDLGEQEEAELWVLKAADQKMPEAFSWLAFNEIEQKNYSKAVVWGKQAADLGDLPGINAVGIAYGYLKQYDSAVDWYKKSWELGDILGAMNLGYHYRFDSINKIEATKWLKIAAETNSVYNGETAFDYADFLRIEMKNGGEACKWYKKSANAKYKEDGNDGVAALKKFCPSNKASPNPVKSALASSEELNLSPPLDPNVKISNIFGRVFKDSDMMWRIILTNSSEDTVPPINGIQFRLVGYEDAGWIGLPYKLKKDLQLNTVYAAVDELFLAVLFKKPVCPEFRAVREEGGKLVNIWTKGQPECSNDYVP